MAARRSASSATAPVGNALCGPSGSTFLPSQLERDFERDLVHCTEFDPREYANRNAALRFRDSVARLFSPLL